jgi:stearoyl-CoA desaturase (delta-9 desaturase)
MHELRSAAAPGAGPSDPGEAAAQGPTWREVRNGVLFSMAVTGLGLLCLVVLAVTGRVDATGLTVFALFFVLTTLGIEVGYHRLLSHGAFMARPAARVGLTVLGAMAMQGAPSFWVTTHRRHHRFADGPKDPHAPDEPTTALRRLWYAHVGWQFDPASMMAAPLDHLRYSRDLIRDDRLRRVEALYHAWVAAGFVLPALLGAVAYGSWTGVVLGLLWGGPIRVFAVNQVIWGTNSVCHTFGARPFDSGDRATNVWWLALLSFGQGWHNGHHAFPASARTGFGIFEPDLGYVAVRTLAALRLASDVHVPDPEAISSRRRQRPD